MYDVRTTYKVAVLIRACIVEYRTLSLLLTAGQLQIFFFFFNNYNANNGHEMFVFQSKLIGCQSWQNWIEALVALGNVNVYYLMDLDFLFGHSTFCFFFLLWLMLSTWLTINQNMLVERESILHYNHFA